MMILQIVLRLACLHILIVSSLVSSLHIWKGRIDERYRTGKVVLETNIWDCFDKLCPDKINCVIAFSENYGFKCYALWIPAQVIIWARKTVLIPDTKWEIAFAKKNLLSKKPTILWLLDEVTRHRNLGTGGKQLDMQPPTAKYLKFNTPGPRKNVDLLYGSNRYKSVIDLRVSGSNTPLFDFSKSFTVAMWIKTERMTGRDRQEVYFTLFDTFPIYHAVRWYLAPQTHKNEMRFRRNYGYFNYAFSSVNNTVDIDEWRHVALVVRSNVDNPDFYLEGYTMGNYRKIVNGSHLPVCSHITMWNGAMGNSPFRGAIACAAFFPYVLSGSEIRILRNNCP